MRVLVIDDEPDVLFLCRVNLQHAGHEVLEALNGERGMELAATDRPDLIVLDIMLPRLDGFSVLKALAADPGTKDTPVVLLTARVQAGDQLRAWRAGCCEYVTKPFSPLGLTDTVQRVQAMTPDERREQREEALARLEARA